MNYFLILTIFILSTCSTKTVNDDFSDNAKFNEYHTFTYQSLEKAVSSKSLIGQKIYPVMTSLLNEKGFQYSDESSSDLRFQLLILNSSNDSRSGNVFVGVGSTIGIGGVGLGIGRGRRSRPTRFLKIIAFDTKQDIEIFQSEVEVDFDLESKTNKKQVEKLIALALKNFPPQK